MERQPSDSRKDPHAIVKEKYDEVQRDGRYEEGMARMAVYHRHCQDPVIFRALGDVRDPAAHRQTTEASQSRNTASGSSCTRAPSPSLLTDSRNPQVGVRDDLLKSPGVRAPSV